MSAAGSAPCAISIRAGKPTPVCRSARASKHLGLSSTVSFPGGTLLVIGSDPKEELPVLFLRIRDTLTRRQGRVVEISPIETSLTALAAHSLRSVPGAVHDTVRALLAGEGDLGAAREALTAGPLTVLVGRGSYAESPDAVVAAIGALAQAFPEARFLSGLRRGNVHGALDLGLTPGLLPGRVDLADGRDWFGAHWDTVPDEAGLDTAGILAAAAEGRIDTLVLLGADPLSDFPDAQLAARGIAGARTVIALSTLPTPSTVAADIVLPVAGFAEVDGTTTNLEGRVTAVNQKVTPPGTARPDWMIAAELALRMGTDLGFTNPAEILDEIVRLSPIHAGITAEALAATPDGLVAAVPTPIVQAPGDEEAGSPAEADETTEASDAEPGDDEPADGGNESVRPSPVAFDPAAASYEAPAVDSYSLRLVTRRRLYDRGTMVAAAPSLAGQATSGSLVANPTDLQRLGVGSGTRVKVTSSRGSIQAPVEPDASVPEGTAVLLWNQGDPSPTALVDAETSVTEVRVETVAGEGRS